MLIKEIKESDNFKRNYKKIDKSLKIKLDKLLLKIIENPEIGKPMRYTRKGTKEIYIKPFRISYSIKKPEGILIFLDLYHKDAQ